jgi:DDE superfamily endonuclease
MLQAIISKFKNFRDQVFRCFSHRADASMELIDALAGNTDAKSVVQLSLSPTFRRGYGSIRDAISAFDKDPGQQSRIEECLIRHCSATTESRPYRLFVLDCTAAPRKHAKTLKDRGIVHAPNVIPGNKPITVGHQYSVVGFLPEQSSSSENIPWMLPLSVRRVATDVSGISVGIEQLDTILPSFGKELVVTLGDTAYSNPKFIQGNQKHENAILIARLRGDRVLNHKAEPKVPKQTNRRTRGHELWYGEEFNFKDETTWGEPSEIISMLFTTRKGKQFTAHIQGWNDILMRQKNGIPLNEHPLRVIRITITDENGNIVYKRPMWLMVCGKRQQELNLIQIWQSYKRRYDIEHFFKFGKMRLLMDKFQTPDTQHEESWWTMVCLAYAQLYMARKLADNMPNPWEKYLPEMKNNTKIKSARQVQKSFLKITTVVGTPANAPKPRGKPLGRAKGAKQPRRIRLPIIIKGQKPPNKLAA